MNHPSRADRSVAHRTTMCRRRILFLASGMNTPATRYRILPYLLRFREWGHLCDLALSVPEKYDSFRWLGWRASQRLKRVVFHLHLLRAHVRRYDAILIERELFDNPTWDMEQKFRRVTNRLVMDVDDAIFLRYPEKFACIAGMCDHILAGNRNLADVCRRYCANVSVVPTAVEIDRYPVKSNHDLCEDETAIIGWIGTPANLPYLSIVLPALRQIQHEFSFVLRIVTSHSRLLAELPLEGIRWEFREWSSSTAVDELAEFTIGIMPLEDREWERYKCGFKLLQYMACGLPAVASPVGVNGEIVVSGENGFLASTDADWAASLRALLTDAELRRTLGRRARQTVERDYSIDQLAPAVFSAVSGTPWSASSE